MPPGTSRKEQLVTVPSDASRAVDAGRLWTGGVATGLLLTTPRPLQFFAWIVALATIAAALAPFLTDADLDEKVATSAIYLAIGIAIGSLLSGVARSAVRRRA
jgi:hypothetical protein